LCSSVFNTHGWWLIKKCILRSCLDHLLEKFVDLVLAISEVTAVDEVVALLAPSASWCVQFEGPEEVVDLLEDASNGVELVDHVFDALDVVSVTQLALDDEVVGDGNATSGVLKASEGHELVTALCTLFSLELTLTKPRLYIN
jgi:hypothetical protein